MARKNSQAIAEERIAEALRTKAKELDLRDLNLASLPAEGEDSDVDLVVVESAPFGKRRSRRREAVRLWRALSGLGVAKDILVYSRDEVEYWRDSLNHVLARALREGRVLYEQP